MDNASMSPVSPTKNYKTFKKGSSTNKKDKWHKPAYVKALGFNLNFDLGDTGDMDLYFTPTNSIQPTRDKYIFKTKVKKYFKHF